VGGVSVRLQPPPPKSSRKIPVLKSNAQAAGRIFWFTRNRLLGSYFFFTVARRS
jgi:hypothetical protein